MLDIIVQVGILVLGGAAIALLAFRSARIARWGWLLGLLSQPFWLYATWPWREGGGQWGIFVLSIWYTWHWSRGVRNFLFGEGTCKKRS